MSDIVERLRAQAADVPITLALDAAVEIERLRTALEKIALPFALERVKCCLENFGGSLATRVSGRPRTQR
jgi:hypothetical protein